MAQWAPLASDANAQKRIEWWREARVGLFMHWGVYAIPGRGEWVEWAEQIPTSEYAKLMTEFHPEHFRAEKWAQTAKDGCMPTLSSRTITHVFSKVFAPQLYPARYLSGTGRLVIQRR